MAWSAESIVPLAPPASGGGALGGANVESEDPPHAAARPKKVETTSQVTRFIMGSSGDAPLHSSLTTRRRGTTPRRRLTPSKTRGSGLERDPARQRRRAVRVARVRRVDLDVAADEVAVRLVDDGAGDLRSSGRPSCGS